MGEMNNLAVDEEETESNELITRTDDEGKFLADVWTGIRSLPQQCQSMVARWGTTGKLIATGELQYDKSINGGAVRYFIFYLFIYFIYLFFDMNR